MLSSNQVTQSGSSSEVQPALQAHQVDLEAVGIQAVNLVSHQQQPQQEQHLHQLQLQPPQSAYPYTYQTHQQQFLHPFPAIPPEASSQIAPIRYEQSYTLATIGLTDEFPAYQHQQYAPPRGANLFDPSAHTIPTDSYQLGTSHENQACYAPMEADLRVGIGIYDLQLFDSQVDMSNDFHQSTMSMGQTMNDHQQQFSEPQLVSLEPSKISHPHLEQQHQNRESALPESVSQLNSTQEPTQSHQDQPEASSSITSYSPDFLLGGSTQQSDSLANIASRSNASDAGSSFNVCPRVRLAATSKSGATGGQRSNSAAMRQDYFGKCEWFKCERTFIQETDLVKHVEDEHVNYSQEKGRYYCRWANCKRNNLEFNARYKLRIHMRVHTGEKPYPCEHQACNKRFSRLENLKIHSRSHSGEKPYECSHEGCSKSFTNSSDRIKHHKTHEDPRPYACPIQNCNKRYTDPSSLRKHQRTHQSNQDIARPNIPTIAYSGQSSFHMSSEHSNYQPAMQPEYSSSHNNNAQQHHNNLQQQQPQQLEFCEASYDPSAMLDSSWGLRSTASNYHCDQHQRRQPHQTESNFCEPGNHLLDHNQLSQTWSGQSASSSAVAPWRAQRAPQQEKLTYLRPESIESQISYRTNINSYQQAPQQTLNQQQWQPAIPNPQQQRREQESGPLPLTNTYDSQHAVLARSLPPTTHFRW